MNEQSLNFEQTLKKSLESKKEHTIHMLESGSEKFRESIDYILIDLIKKKGEYLPYSHNPENQVSALDEKPKFTDGLVNCTGVTVTAIEKISGKNISFISHSPSPDNFDVVQSYKTKLKEEATGVEGRKHDDKVKNFEMYESILQERMKEMAERCEEGSFRATIYGGAVIERYEKGGMHDLKTDEDTAEEYLKRLEGYQRSIEALQAVTTSCLGIEAKVIEPVTEIPAWYTGTEIYLDTKNNDLYVRYSKED